MREMKKIVFNHLIYKVEMSINYAICFNCIIEHVFQDNESPCNKEDWSALSIQFRTGRARKKASAGGINCDDTYKIVYWLNSAGNKSTDAGIKMAKMKRESGR